MNQITSKEAADLLGVSTETVRNWANLKILNTTKTPNGHRRFNLSEVEKLCKRKIKTKPSLEETHPELSKEWHPTKNYTLTTSDVSRGMDKKVWWKCDTAEDHEWEASLLDRTRRGNKCPFCARKNKVVLSNCLATTHPHLLKEWHPTKNEFSPYDFLSGNKTKVWWKCEKEHEWLASINNRSKPNATGCPYCISETLLDVNPKLSLEWHPTKNANLTPDMFSPNSGVKVWWKCNAAEDHEWEATIINRNKNNGCPCCSLFKIVQSNCLSTTHPKLSEEWHIDNDLSPMEVTAGSTKKVWWQCVKNKNHKWKTSIRIRSCLINPSGCPYCKSSFGEKIIEKELERLQIPFKKEWSHDDCVNVKKLRFDFAIFEKDSLKCLIEYQGIQHYEPVSFGSKEDPIKKLISVQKNDSIKKNFCKQNKIPLLVIPYYSKKSIKTMQQFLINLELNLRDLP